MLLGTIIAVSLGGWDLLRPGPSPMAVKRQAASKRADAVVRETVLPDLDRMVRESGLCRGGFCPANPIRAMELKSWNIMDGKTELQMRVSGIIHDESLAPGFEIEMRVGSGVPHDPLAKQSPRTNQLIMAVLDRYHFSADALAQMKGSHIQANSRYLAWERSPPFGGWLLRYGVRSEGNFILERYGPFTEPNSWLTEHGSPAAQFRLPVR